MSPGPRYLVLPLREQIVRKALLLRVDDVPLEGYFNRG
jgi:hypothetical protein